MRVGWLRDNPLYTGGAEITTMTFAQAAPEGVVIVDCPPGGAVVEDVDCYVVHNCTQYRSDIIGALEKKPVVKMVYDLWPHGDGAVKEWFLYHAEMVVLVTPGLRRFLPKIQADMVCIPSPVDPQKFEEAARAANGRDGAVWIGALFPHKGLDLALNWAREQKKALDVYGFGNAGFVQAPGVYRGQLEYDEIPETMARYEQFVFLPTQFDPCPRTVLEAWFAGCELVINENVGSKWWIENNPIAIERATESFWDVVQGVVDDDTVQA